MSNVAAVLVVEDDALVRMVACELVEEAGFVAVEARDADQAVAILERREDIRLVFTDVHMPGSMDGVMLSRLVRDRWPPIHLMVTSGKAILHEGQLPHGTVFFGKPYEGGLLVETMRRILLGPQGPSARIVSVG
jgi:CheY-like chemotaxis protein